MQLQCWVMQTQLMATMLQCKCGALGGGRSADASGSKSTTARNVNPQICKRVQHFDWSTHVGKNRWCSSLCSIHHHLGLLDVDGEPPPRAKRLQQLQLRLQTAHRGGHQVQIVGVKEGRCLHTTQSGQVLSLHSRCVNALTLTLITYWWWANLA